MAVLIDRISQRNPSVQQGSAPQQQQSPLPTINKTINRPNTVASRVRTLPQRGSLGSDPTLAHEPRRFVADIPSNEQLEGIASILSGQDSASPVINNFVRGMSKQGKTPDQIRLAFIQQQKNSNNPLVI